MAKYVEYFKYENTILRSRLTKQIHTTYNERLILLKYGKVLGRAIEELISIVSPATFARWVWDGRYTKEFTETLKQSGIKINPLPIASLNLNGRCERFIKTIKLEWLVKFIILGKQHFDYLISEFTTYYNLSRSHTARRHLPPIRELPVEVEKILLDEVQVISHIGGLVKTFERKSAEGDEIGHFESSTTRICSA